MAARSQLRPLIALTPLAIALACGAPATAGPTATSTATSTVTSTSSATSTADAGANADGSADGPNPTDTRLLEQPALSATHLAFVYAGDLWVAHSDGSGARRLTSHPGQESRPRFSPDGQWLAFSGEYDGNVDVFVMPVAGGEPRRLTTHPGADVVQGFTADGRELLFTSQRDVHSGRFQHLFRVSVIGGWPTRLPLPSCSKAALSPDGRKIAYLPLSEAFQQWKNYRGGRTSRIWICDLADLSIEQVPQPEGRCNDTDPMWLGDENAAQLFFRSDRAGEFNLFTYDLRSKSVQQKTTHADFPILNATAGPDAIVYEQAGWLHRFDPNAARAERLVVGVAADLIETRPRFVKGEQYLRSASLSPSGARVAFGFRGEIVTLPAEKGDPRNMTQSPGVNERDPAWSPDGKTIAWSSDEGGSHHLVLAPQDGRGERRALTLPGAGFYRPAGWSRDSSKLAVIDNARVLWLLDVATGATQKVGAEPVYGVFQSIAVAWAPDSKWLAYTLAGRTGFRRLHLFDVATGQSHAVTDGLADVTDPAFDASGKYLWFAASTDAGPTLNWFSLTSSDLVQSSSLYVVCLKKGTPSPFAPESDEEKPAAAESASKDDAKAADKTASASEPAASSEPSIDLEGLMERTVALPLPPANYSNLAGGADGQLWYVKLERVPYSGTPPRPALARFDLSTRKEKVVQEGVDGFELSADRKKLLISGSDGRFVVAAGDTLDKSKGKLAIDAIEVRIEPRAEWAQILDEVWRINRDWFYDPGMHGADWPAMRERYAQFLPHLATRGDLNRVIQWLCSELAVGHSYSGGGDTLIAGKPVAGGLLGADYEVVDGRYRFAKVFGGPPFAPELRAPLAAPGVEVKPGEYLLAVDGIDLLATEELFARFEGRAGKQVELTVGPTADGAGARSIKVVPIENESALRNRDWVEGNLRRVTEATNGRVAYVYVPNTSDAGFTYFKRWFFPQVDREALIIDERMNGGGSYADYIIDLLRRPYTAHWATRYGESFITPQGALFGPSVMLIDETAGSGGDLLPWMFRKFGLGKLIGRPTWGGLVGILGFPELMDGGSVTAPNLAIWTEDDGFCVENVGVPPDLEVEMLPAECVNGRDPQLERAIEEALAELARNPPQPAKQPPFPVRARR